MFLNYSSAWNPVIGDEIIAFSKKKYVFIHRIWRVDLKNIYLKHIINIKRYRKGRALSRDWAALDRDAAHSVPVIRRSKFSVSPACHNQVTWLATSAQQLTLLAVAKSKQLCQEPRPCRHYATPWRRHLQNITVFRNLELDTFRDVKSTGKYWLNFVFLTSRDTNKTV